MMEFIANINSGIRNGVELSVLKIQAVDDSICIVLDLNLDNLANYCQVFHSNASDLLLIASIVYLLDRSIPRKFSPDSWTREFIVDIPVISPDIWNGLVVELQSLLSFLTGDNWLFSFRKCDRLFFNNHNLNTKKYPILDIRKINLFSGGLDSLVGAINTLNIAGNETILVGHHDATGARGDQQRIFSLLKEDPKYIAIPELVSVRLRPLPKRYSKENIRNIGSETTLRSRSFIFLALTTFIASGFGRAIQINVPENGFIAVNIPLTPSRVGTCSTRTTHPSFLQQFQNLLDKVGLNYKISNPFEFMTKGEVLTNCVDRFLLNRCIPVSVSCAHPSRRMKWIRKNVRNCGYCVPCIIRRSSLHYINSDVGDHYGFDIFSSEFDVSYSVASDLRAMLDCLSDVQNQDEIENRVLSTGTFQISSLDMYTNLITRGLNEIRQLISDKGTKTIKHRAGLQ